MITTHNQVCTTCVLTEQRVQYRLAGTGVKHVKAVARNHHRVGWKVQVDHLANRGIPDIRGNISRLEFPQKHVDQNSVRIDRFKGHLA